MSNLTCLLQRVIGGVSMLSLTSRFQQTMTVIATTTKTHFSGD